MMNFKGEFTRFENPEDSLFGNRPPTDGGMIYDSAINGEIAPPNEMPTPFK